MTIILIAGCTYVAVTLPWGYYQWQHLMQRVFMWHPLMIQHRCMVYMLNTSDIGCGRCTGAPHLIFTARNVPQQWEMQRYSLFGRFPYFWHSQGDRWLDTGLGKSVNVESIRHNNSIYSAIDQPIIIQRCVHYKTIQLTVLFWMDTTAHALLSVVTSTVTTCTSLGILK